MYKYFILFIVDSFCNAISTLELEGNQLQNLHTYLRNSQIYYLDVSKNNLEFLTEENFNFVYGLTYLKLQENEIRRMERDAFKFIRKDLFSLDISYNKISSINGSLKYLSKLERLYLSYNFLQVKHFLT